jgi:microcin C transport system substrate-binding protein
MAVHRRSELSIMRRILTACCIALLLGSSLAVADEEQTITRSWAIAEFGEPLYRDGIEHWPYANPDAPKGGIIVQGAFGSFDSLNVYVLRGTWASGIGLIYDSLMTGSGDELASLYGLIAESVEYPEDKSWIVFNLRPEARFHDGTPITAHDFEFTFDVIREHGRPFLQSFYEEVDEVEVLDDHRLKFTFKTRDSMKPLIKIAGLSPEPRHYWAERDISRTFLEPQLSSGPYRIAALDPGRSITYERVEDYWAADLPVNRGLNNFDRIRYDYYRDMEVMFEAFKAGEIDFRAENSARRWATGYDIEQVRDGRMITETIPDENPQGIQAFFFNLRRDKFSEARVREALGQLFDFEAIQRTVLYGQYTRVDSYFPNSDFGVDGGLPTDEELAILEPYRDQLPEEVFTRAFEPPRTDGSGNIRAQLREALRLLNEAGWQLQDGRLIKDDRRMNIEFLTVSADSERIIAPFIQNLRRVGIEASIRLVDSAQYERRIDERDFDVITVRLNFFPPPGPELRSYYGSAAADVEGSANMAGIKHPVVDALIEQVINAEDLDTLKATNRALDRVLLWQHYVIPQFYNDAFRIAYWDRFDRPETLPRYGTGFPTTWWLDAEKDSRLSLRR